MTKESKTQQIVASMERIIILLNQIYEQVYNQNLQNEQWFLDFQDKLNELSVK